MCIYCICMYSTKIVILCIFLIHRPVMLSYTKKELTDLMSLILVR